MGRQKDPSAKPTANGSAAPAKEPERLPAYFLSLSLENVRCFGPKQTLNLSTKDGKPAQWTIILGLNGRGKTTLLQLLAASNLEYAFDKTIGEEVWSPQVTKHVPLFRDTILRSTQGISEWESTFGRASSLHIIPRTTISWQFKNTRAGISFTASNDRPHSLEFWCCAYGVSRRIGSTSLEGGESDDPTATLFSDRAELRNAEEWLLQLDYAAKSKNKDAEHRLTQAKELLIAIMPEGEVTDIRFTTTGGVNPKARAEFLAPDGWVPLRQLGYGYQTLITWVADLVSRMAERYPDSKNPLAEPAVVLVDEIDLHLHPKWQRKLMSFLTERFPNTQFIATAHSPLVVQAAADANLAVLRREGDHVVIDNEVDNIRNWRIDQILTSDLFGLETARPPQIEALIVERNKLLDKSKLSAAEKRRLEELNELVGELPFGETAQERKERDTIKKALDLLMKERKPAS